MSLIIPPPRSRWKSEQPLTTERLKDFVALNNLTAQVPLIEVTRKQKIRIWVAYDETRTKGTYVEVNVNGLVRTTTIYPSGRKDEIINRPAYKIGRVQKAKGPHSAVRKSRRSKGVPKRAWTTSAEE